jgi:hypothetical protein
VFLGGGLFYGFLLLSNIILLHTIILLYIKSLQIYYPPQSQSVAFTHTPPLKIFLHECDEPAACL